MDMLLAVIVFLLGAAVGVLVLLYITQSRNAERLIETAERLAQERREHTDATATVFLKEGRIIAQAILKELRTAAKERRELIDFAKSDWDQAPASGEEPASGPASDSRPVSGPGISTLPPDAPTPQGGYLLSDLLEKTQEGSQ
jgi:hypothetical protein